MALTEIPHHSADNGLDRFIPIRKSDIVDALIKEDVFTSDGERDKLRQLCRILGSIYHYQYFGLLERLRNDYYYFNPEIGPHAALDGEQIECWYSDLLRSLDKVLKDANFTELPVEDIAKAHEQRTALRVAIETPLDDFREVRFYRRGRHAEQSEVIDWFGLRRRKVEVEVYDDVVLLAAMKPGAEIGSSRTLRKLERHKMQPGSVLLKGFRNIASGDINALFPNVRVVMSSLDKLMLGLPAIAGGIPILLNLYATITVLFLVIGFYLGLTASVEDKDMKTALAALSGLVALGSFILQQWVKYQRQSLKYRIELSENVYYRNISNNAGLFDYIVSAAEDQESKEAFLAYHFLHAAPSPPTASELDSRIEAWLRQAFGLDLDFDVSNALSRLDQLGLLERQAERLSVAPLDGALAQLHRLWDDFFPAGQSVATQ